MSEALREELHPHGIGVTAVCPGVINTPITRNSRARGAADRSELRERYIKLYERRGYGPDRVARNVFKSVARGRIVAPVSPEAWVSYGMKRASPRFAGWVARKISESTR
jgi:NAD(P)-dependent dehydrogenase (short-subunit alcohol dehydrogenase family)